MKNPRWIIVFGLALEVFSYAMLLSINPKIALAIYLLHWSINLKNRRKQENDPKGQDSTKPDRGPTAGT